MAAIQESTFHAAIYKAEELIKAGYTVSKTHFPRIYGGNYYLITMDAPSNKQTTGDDIPPMEIETPNLTEPVFTADGSIANGVVEDKPVAKQTRNKVSTQVGK